MGHFDREMSLRREKFRHNASGPRDATPTAPDRSESGGRAMAPIPGQKRGRRLMAARSRSKHTTKKGSSRPKETLATEGWNLGPQRAFIEDGADSKRLRTQRNRRRRYSGHPRFHRGGRHRVRAG